MWKLYSVNTKNAVAIQITAARLNEALDRNPSVKIGKVKYVDFNKRFASINGAYWYKRNSFEHEREVRAIIEDHSTSTRGLSITININSLMDCLFISPYTPKWFEDVIYSVVEKYGLHIPVVHSDMAQRTFY